MSALHSYVKRVGTVLAIPRSAIALEIYIAYEYLMHCVATGLNVKAVHYATEDRSNLLLSSMNISLLKTLLILEKVRVPLLRHTFGSHLCFGSTLS